MRKLNSNELQHVYGGGGSECGSGSQHDNNGSNGNHYGQYTKDKCGSNHAKSNSCGSAKSVSYSQNKCY